jgi:hypothetical protein
MRDGIGEGAEAGHRPYQHGEPRDMIGPIDVQHRAIVSIIPAMSRLPTASRKRSAAVGASGVM